MKKWVLLLFAMTCIFASTLHAAAANDETVVALGADLSADQRAKVLELMGMTEADLAECKVITITNVEEHQYLDAYLDTSVIGTKSLTSVKMTKAEKGEGLQVTTQNVNFCTTGMYRNALVTAGVDDMKVLVVAPTPISGTAGLIGAIKAYETAENKTVSEKVLDTALDELITTGEIEQAVGQVSDEDVEAMMTWLKGEIASGELDTGDEKSVRDTIEEGEAKFGVTLSDKEIEQIANLLTKLDKLGLDGSYLLGEAEKLLAKYGSDIANHTGDALRDAVGDANEAINNAAKEAASSAVKNFFKSLGDSVKEMFSKLFGRL